MSALAPEGLSAVIVTVADATDAAGYLALAAQVEHWFGPMVHDPGFQDVVDMNIHRGTAICVRRPDNTGLGLIEVTTFSHDHPAAAPSGARKFYEQLGFAPAEPADAGPDGTPRQWYRKHLR